MEFTTFGKLSSLMKWQQLRDRAALSAKRLLYGLHGEPYEFAGQTLRFVPGTRPVRRKFIHSANLVNRDDVLEILWLESHLEKGSVALDVGAHCGIYSVLMATRCSRVVAFEPDPHARAVLARNVKLNSQSKIIDIEGLACSDREGEAVLFSRGGNSNSSLARSGAGAASMQFEEISVPTATLDSYIQAHNLRADCVKIDTEGAEIRILSGARDLLASDAEILCELHPYVWPEFGNTFEELQSLMRASNRTIRYLDPERPTDPIRYGMTLLEKQAA